MLYCNPSFPFALASITVLLKTINGKHIKRNKILKKEFFNNNSHNMDSQEHWGHLVH